LSKLNGFFLSKIFKHFNFEAFKTTKIIIMQNQNLSPELWTREEASKIKKVSKKTVDRLLRHGRIRGFKIGSKVLIYPNSFTEENINAIRPKFNNKW
jgi:excisionase family DNA binding protein